MFISEKLVSLFAPHRCLACGTTGELLCRQCLGKMRVPRRPACFACNRLSAAGKTCTMCSRKYPVKGVTIASYYDEPVRAYIAAVKYDGAGSQAALGASLLGPLLDRAEYDLVTWVPASPSRLRVRGYNQAEFLAKAIARQLRLPYADTLGRQGYASQVGRSRNSRLAEIKGQYYYLGHHVKNKRVLLVDDVITTGATVGECSRQLKAAGAKTVWAAAIAKH